jgi:ureidoacrylate peracid hydrolase
MHRVSLSADLLGQIRAQRGKLHPFEYLDMRRTAHVVVDLQNGFMEPGAPVEVPAAREIVPNVNRITAAVRYYGGRNVFLRMTVDAESRSSWSNWFAHMHTVQGGAAIVQGFARNAHYWQLWPELEVAPADHVLEKTRFGAFVPGASTLHQLLQEYEVDTLIITGTLSNCCCESTARDAMQMNYKIIFVADGNATLTDAAHAATLENMAMLFADVMTTEELVGAMDRSAAARGA